MAHGTLDFLGPSVFSFEPTTTDNSYTVVGDGVIIVSACNYSNTASGYGTWRAMIYLNGTIIHGEGSRWGTTNVSERFGASACCSVEVSDGDVIRIVTTNNKTGTKTILRHFMCFGCSISAN